jgi:hypothetical protein
MLSKLNKGAEVISAPQPSGTTTSSNLKRKHGHRRRNQIPKRGQLVIEQLSDKGEPVEPKGIASRFWNIVSAIVRDQLGLGSQLVIGRLCLRLRRMYYGTK